MELRERLERLRELQNLNLGLKRASELPQPDPKDRRGRPDAPAASGAAPSIPGDEDQSPDVALGGRVLETPYGPTMVIERDYPLSHSHGRVPVQGALSVTGEPLAHLLRRSGAEGWDWTRAAFFDTETTGLAGGTGTYIFLAGIGQVVGDQFRLTQFFLRDYAEESAWLWAVAEHMKPFKHLVTFNGKAFDWPLVVTRFTLQRWRAPKLGDDHLDLLHPARRLWRERLERCNLQALEQGILGFERAGDVPGYLIPQLYFDYLQTGYVSPLAQVAEHNRLDILAMAALVGELGRIFADPLGLDLPAADLYSLGRHFELENAPRQAVACYEQSLSRDDLPDGTRHKVWRNLSGLYKKLRQDAAALTLWRELIDRGLVGSLWPHIELAKHYEHRARDISAARQVVAAALEVAQTRRALLRLAQSDPILDELRHRLQRLDRKLATAESRAAESRTGAAAATHATKRAPRRTAERPGA
ncbi:MAG: ribonuclease H-like domain-containing protein [Symbiobacteriia bacterium]